MNRHFQSDLKEELQRFLCTEEKKFLPEDILKADLHCHDYNSDVPDELIGRLLRVPETWVSSERLLEELQKNGCNAFTITNHNNARSCYLLQDKGLDILTGAEFSCRVPDFDIGIHVLAYGFTPEQEVRLNKLRKNLYSFQEYTREQDIPTIWAHPLYHYASKEMPPQDFFNKMLLLFERFETLNGQRDTWQNLLVKEWISQTTEEDIDRFSREYNIEPDHYCAQPYKKILTGGSDSHMGIFSGQTGSYVYIPDLQERLKKESHSQLLLEAIRKGDLATFGSHQNTEKLTLAFLNYACQIAMNYKDPGLVRLLLHKGTTRDKLLSLAASNIFCEVQNHKVTMSFIRLFYESMSGHKPAFYKRLLLSPAYKPVFDQAAGIAGIYKKDRKNMASLYYESLLSINRQLNQVLTGRLKKKIAETDLGKGWSFSLDTFISQLELPTGIRSYTGKHPEKDGLNVSGFLDGLSFPFFASLFILAAHFTSAKTLFNTRPFLKQFSRRLGKFEQPARVLWLTDTFGDTNGVSMFLRQMHRQIKERNLPIDIVCCHEKVESDEHLIVLKPQMEFTIPGYREQTIRIPDFIELHNLFLEGEYDRIVCSTEGIMGIFALYLKQAYTVEATFYLHTDWIMFARKVLGMTNRNTDRLRRILRFFYRSFDRVLVLNSDQQKWLNGPQMSLNPNQVSRTSHWPGDCFHPHVPDKPGCFGFAPETPVVMYAGRISIEKGVMELPFIFERIRKEITEVQLIIIGKGPASEDLKKKLPAALFIDWIEQEKLAKVYSSADMLLLPSRFDTFCNVVLESLCCGLPVTAYNHKGPKDIIIDHGCGFLTENKTEMADRVIEYLQNGATRRFRQAALERAKDFNADHIVHELLGVIGLGNA